MKRLLPFFIFSFSFFTSFGQSNVACTDSIVAHILLGNYNPSTYFASNILNQPDTIFKGINARVNADSLKSYIITMAGFYNRNTASDTISTTQGIGAARRWVYSKFQQYSAANQNRLLPSYLQVALNICGPTQHRNIIAVLPGI